LLHKGKIDEERGKISAVIAAGGGLEPNKIAAKKRRILIVFLQLIL
jgi:hypothetical protein